MKQNEIEKNGLTAPASPVATTFTPFVGEIGGKPVLVWGVTPSGLARLKNTDFTHNPSAVPVSRIPAIRHLEVVEGKKSRYAVLKVGYLDLTTGNLVSDEVRAAIDKARAPAPVSVVAPVPTPVSAVAVAPVKEAPAPTPAPAPVAATSAAAPFRWQEWWELLPTKDEIVLFSGTFAEETVEEMASVIEEVFDELQKEVCEATTCYDTTEDQLKQAIQELWQFSARAKKFQERFREADDECLEDSCVVWAKLDFPIEISYSLWKPTWLDTNSTLTRTIVWSDDCKYSIGTTGNGEFIISEELVDENDNVYQWAVARGKVTDLLDQPAFKQYLMGHVQKIYGYHPDQLTLF
jgi:hypothetical protein